MPTVDINQTFLYYNRIGTGVPCLVMHGGLGVDQSCYRGLDMFSNALDLIYYDHRSNGRSGRPPLESLTHAQLADDAEALRQHLGLGKVAVMGHSYGGFIALEYALRYPNSVSHLILLDTAPGGPRAEETEENAIAKNATPEMLEALQHFPGKDEEMKSWLKLIFPLYFHHYKPEYAAILDDIVFSALGEKQGEMLSTYNTIPQLHTISCPTLILVGRHDFICPLSQSQIIHEHIPNSRLAVFDHSGHFPWVEEPELFVQTVNEWLKQVDG
jgi:proline iminopeptidase